jgi:hypothetical protein
MALGSWRHKRQPRHLSVNSVNDSADLLIYLNMSFVN